MTEDITRAFTPTERHSKGGLQAFFTTLLQEGQVPALMLFVHRLHDVNHNLSDALTGPFRHMDQAIAGLVTALERNPSQRWVRRKQGRELLNIIHGLHNISKGCGGKYGITAEERAVAVTIMTNYVRTRARGRQPTELSGGHRGVWLSRMQDVTKWIWSVRDVLLHWDITLPDDTYQEQLAHETLLLYYGQEELLRLLGWSEEEEQRSLWLREVYLLWRVVVESGLYGFFFEGERPKRGWEEMKGDEVEEGRGAGTRAVKKPKHHHHHRR